MHTLWVVFSFPALYHGFLWFFCVFTSSSSLSLSFIYSLQTVAFFAPFAFLLFFAEPCFSLAPHFFFLFSIVATEQWLAQKPPHVSLHPPVHSLPRVHRHRLRRVRPPQRVRTPERRLPNTTTRGCTSGLPSTCLPRRQRNSPPNTSPTY